MKGLILLMTNIVLLLQIFGTRCDLSSLGNSKKYEKFFLNDIKPVHSLEVSTENYAPFMYLDKSGHFHGIEYSLIKTIAEKEQLNLSLTFSNQFRPLDLERFIFRKKFWTRKRFRKFRFQRRRLNFTRFASCAIFHFQFSLVPATFSHPHDSTSSRYNHVLGSSADVLAAGIFPNVSFQRGWTISKPYYQDDLTWCLRRAKMFPLILNLAAAAPPEIWICTIFGIGHGTALVFYVMVQFDSKYKQRNNRDWSYMLFVVAFPAGIGINQRFQPKSILLRLFYGFVLIMSLFIWQILFLYGTRFLQVPVRRAQISTVAEIVSNDFHLMGSTEVLALISFDERVHFHKKLITELVFVSVNSSFVPFLQFKKSQVDSFYTCTNIDRCLEHLKHDDSHEAAIGASRQRILNSRFYSPEQVYCFNQDENIASYQPALLMRKGFALTDGIDKIIRNAFEGGLFVKWDRDNQRKKEQKHSFTPKLTLTLQEMVVLFVFILTGGWMLSTFIFINERFIHKKMQQLNPSRTWTFLEQMVDGRRHYFRNLIYKNWALSKYKSIPVLTVSMAVHIILKILPKWDHNS